MFRSKSVNASIPNLLIRIPPCIWTLTISERTPSSPEAREPKIPPQPFIFLNGSTAVNDNVCDAPSPENPKSTVFASVGKSAN